MHEQKCLQFLSKHMFSLINWLLTNWVWAAQKAHFEMSEVCGQMPDLTHVKTDLSHTGHKMVCTVTSVPGSGGRTLSGLFALILICQIIIRFETPV